MVKLKHIASLDKIKIKIFATSSTFTTLSTFDLIITSEFTIYLIYEFNVAQNNHRQLKVIHKG